MLPHANIHERLKNYKMSDKDGQKKTGQKKNI